MWVLVPTLSTTWERSRETHGNKSMLKISFWFTFLLYFSILKFFILIESLFYLPRCAIHLNVSFCSWALQKSPSKGMWSSLANAFQYLFPIIYRNEEKLKDRFKTSFETKKASFLKKFQPVSDGLWSFSFRIFFTGDNLFYCCLTTFCLIDPIWNFVV